MSKLERRKKRTENVYSKWFTKQTKNTKDNEQNKINETDAHREMQSV